MCHRVYVTLSAEDKKEVKKLSGVMIPVYAAIMLALITVVAISGGSRQGELVASTATPSAAR
jgi:hypothetical protein